MLDGEAVVSGHTPGPWAVDAKYLSEVQTSDNKTIASCWHKHADGQHIQVVGVLCCSLEESAANASLIAAAPDLLAALTDLMPTITCMERHGIRYDPAQVEAARAAIARASASLTQGDGHGG